MDSHRSPAFLISPYVKRHAVDSTMYNTTSMLRTIEFLLGLQPMTQFDAGARPMTAVVPADARSGAVHRREAAHLRSTTSNPAAHRGRGAART